MSKPIITILIFLVFLSAKSQNWDSVPHGSFNQQLERVFYDSIHDKLIASSKFINSVGSLRVRGIASWNGMKWDSLAGGINTDSKIANPNTPNGMALACTPYYGKTLYGGMFSSVGGINASSLALWDGVKWDSLPKRAFRFDPSNPKQVIGFYKKNNLLYIYGAFDTIAGQRATGLATWDGSNFNPILLPYNNSAFQGKVNDMIEFNNELYVCGGFFVIGGNGVNDILKYNGTSWISTTGGGIQGGFSGLYSMTIYNNELYVGGHFTIAAGNQGENIMKWNGSQWKDVGFGGEPTGGPSKLLVHHNKLWAIGNYRIAAHQKAWCASVYDGVYWCSLKDTMDNALNYATIYHDTIFVGGGFLSAEGDTHISYIAKLKAPTLYKQCVNVGIKEYSSLYNGVSIYPNPASNTLFIETEQNIFENSEIEITNSLGQIILSLPFKKEIDVSKLSQGFYNLKITTENKQTYYSKFIRE